MESYWKEISHYQYQYQSSLLYRKGCCLEAVKTILNTECFRIHIIFSIISLCSRAIQIHNNDKGCVLTWKLELVETCFFVSCRRNLTLLKRKTCCFIISLTSSSLSAYRLIFRRCQWDVGINEIMLFLSRSFYANRKRSSG